MNKNLKNKNSYLHDQKGQLVIEMVLLLTVLVSLISFVSKGLIEKKYLQNLVQKPFEVLQGMAENGSWGSPNNTKSLHPNLHFRHISQETKP
jgi:hypothetical protein